MKGNAISVMKNGFPVLVCMFSNGEMFAKQVHSAGEKFDRYLDGFIVCSCGYLSFLTC